MGAIKRNSRVQLKLIAPCQRFI